MRFELQKLLKQAIPLRIGDVAKTAGGSTPSRSRNDFWATGGGTGVPWVRTAEIKFEPILKTQESVSEIALRECSLPMGPPGTVLIAMFGEGKTRGQSAVLGIEATFNQACFAIFPNEAFDPDYLQLWLMGKYRELRRLADGRGGSQANLNGSILADLSVPWVERDIQVQVVATLRERLSVVRKAQAAARRQLEELELLPQKLLRQKLGDLPVAIPQDVFPVSATAGRKWSRLTELAKLESGHTPSRQRSEWWGGDISWLSLTEIRKLDGRWVSETRLRTNKEGIAHSSARLLPRGTVCLSRTASVGFVAIMARSMATSQDFANWVCGTELDPEFLMYVLIASRGYFRRIAVGATHKTIYMPALESFHILHPPLEVQKKIAHSLKQSLTVICNASEAARLQLEELELLPQKLLSHIFGS